MIEEPEAEAEDPANIQIEADQQQETNEAV